jgi:metal-dependent amidase/aminoacylase/carboxypeptidase family protein
MHQHPEIAFKEFKTQQRIMDYLTVNLNINKENIRKCAGTGLIVDLKGKGKPKNSPFCIALRADIDALPMKENNPHLEY